MDDVAVLLEHVDLLDTLDGLDVQLLESGLELLVIGAGVADDLLDLAAGGTLATVKFVSWLDIGWLRKCGWLGVDEWVNEYTGWWGWMKLGGIGKDRRNARIHKAESQTGFSELCDIYLRVRYLGYSVVAWIREWKIRSLTIGCVESGYCSSKIRFLCREWRGRDENNSGQRIHTLLRRIMLAIKSGTQVHPRHASKLLDRIVEVEI